MTYAFDCSTFGKQSCDGLGMQTCPCGKRHLAYQTGVEGLPGIGSNVIGDELRVGFDWAAGKKFTSRSARRAYYQSHGMVLLSAREHYRKHGAPPILKGKAFSYPGKSHHESTGERGTVRTATGQEII